MNLWTRGLVALLLAAFATLTVFGLARLSATYDEPQHLAVGYSILRWHDYRLGPEHPPLVRMLCAFPLLFQSVWPESPELSAEDLQTPPKHVTALRVAQEAWAWALANNDAQFYFGRVFLYGWNDAAAERHQWPHPLNAPTTATLAKSDFVNDAERLIFWGRLPVALLGVLLGWLVFVWARDLFGVAGGVLALALFCFDPNFIAHAGLITTDVGATFFIAGTVYFLWRACRRWRVVDAALAALFCALSFASKFTAVVLLPVFLLVGLWLLWRDRQLVWRYLGLVAAMLLVSWLGLWTVYGFR
jgi:hypothetical protein